MTDVNPCGQIPRVPRVGAIASPARAGRRAGFSLVELVIVVVIIALLAAIAIPRMSRGTEGAAESATAQNLAVLQKALDHYAAEHGGSFPKADKVADQLTLYSDAQGNVSKQKTATFMYGPYVFKVPPLPQGPNKGSTTISKTPGAGVGWVYKASDGSITANLADTAASSGTTIGATTQPVATPPVSANSVD